MVLPKVLIAFVGYRVVRKAVCAGILDAKKGRAAERDPSDDAPRAS